jgi:hypothetical protein
MFCDADLMNFFRTASCAEGTLISLTAEQLIMAAMGHDLLYFNSSILIVRNFR